MNQRSIAFSAVVTSAIGAMLGIAIAEMANPPYESDIYQHAHRKYAIVGAVLGAAVGSAQETVRQLKAEAERRERDRMQHYTERDRHSL
ncbi:hypothetical protein CKA32_002000 [Geitlerinema sp. FC II]|nr:hypothetical protein CKA32_002000 [Geitlerinema sp. FC II]